LLTLQEGGWSGGFAHLASLRGMRDAAWSVPTLLATLYRELVTAPDVGAALARPGAVLSQTAAPGSPGAATADTGETGAVSTTGGDEAVGGRGRGGGGGGETGTPETAQPQVVWRYLPRRVYLPALAAGADDLIVERRPLSGAEEDSQRRLRAFHAVVGHPR